MNGDRLPNPKEGTVYPQNVCISENIAHKKIALVVDNDVVNEKVEMAMACSMADVKNILILCEEYSVADWRATLALFYENGEGISVRCYSDVYSGKLEGETTWDVCICERAHHHISPANENLNTLISNTSPIHRSVRKWFLSNAYSLKNKENAFHLAKICDTFSGSYEDFLKTFFETEETPFGTAVRGKKSSYKLPTVFKEALVRKEKGDTTAFVPTTGVFVSSNLVSFGSVDDEILFPSLETGLRDPELPAKLIIEQNYASQVRAIAKTANEYLHIMNASQDSLRLSRRYAAHLKLAAISDRVRDCFEDKRFNRLIIVTRSASVLNELWERLSDVSCVRFTESVTEKQLMQFQTGNGNKVAFVPAKGLGKNIRIPGCRNIWFIEPNWDPSDCINIIGMCQRITRDDGIYADFFYVDNPFDETITRALSKSVVKFLSTIE